MYLSSIGHLREGVVERWTERKVKKVEWIVKGKGEKWSEVKLEFSISTETSMFSSQFIFLPVLISDSLVVIHFGVFS